jgi:hypothetical protein
MARALVKVLLAAMLLVSAGQAARAEKRVALVIGNGAYQKAPELANQPHRQPGQYMSLEGYVPIEPILSLPDIRRREAEIMQVRDELSVNRGGALPTRRRSRARA